MYPSRFAYEAPSNLDEAIGLLHQGAGEAKVLAGGQSLVPLIKLRFASPEMLVDINNLPGLDTMDFGADGSIRIGALVRHRDLERSVELPPRAAGDGRGSSAHRGPDRAHPRHPRRLAVPRRSPGGLGGGGHGHRRTRRGAGPRRAPEHPDRRLRHRALPERPGVRRGRGRGRDPGTEGAGRRRVPQAGAPGRRLRHGRHRGRPGADGRPGRPGRHRADRRRQPDHQRHGGGRLARRAGADAPRRSPAPPTSRPRPPSPTPTTAAARRTSGTSSTPS